MRGSAGRRCRRGKHRGRSTYDCNQLISRRSLSVDYRSRPLSGARLALTNDWVRSDAARPLWDEVSGTAPHPHPDLRQRHLECPQGVNCGASSSAFADGEPVFERQTLWCGRSKTSANLSVVRLSGQCCVLNFARDDLPVGIQGDWELWRDPPSLMATASRIDPRASPSRQRRSMKDSLREAKIAPDVAENCEPHPAHLKRRRVVML